MQSQNISQHLGPGATILYQLLLERHQQLSVAVFHEALSMLMGQPHAYDFIAKYPNGEPQYTACDLLVNAATELNTFVVSQ